MKSKHVLVSLVLAGFAATATALGAGIASSFASAPAGVPVASSVVELPPVNPRRPLATSVAVPASGPFAPSLSELLQGETVITTDAQMQAVWKQLFDVPYDAGLFDFGADFVVLMGNGKMQLGSFSISSVERVDAEYDSLLFFGNEIDPFVAVTATTVLPGILPIELPPPTWRVSAVRVPLASLDDVVFHRTVLAAP